jgi:serine/threonine protein kinase
MRQIVSGLNFLHSNKILHRDLKLDNILVTFKSDNDKNSLNMMKAVVKIIDFGFATTLKSKNSLTYTVLGTPTYMDPQLLSNMESKTPNIQGYDDKADIWSLGTLCYEMLVGHMAFSGTSMQELFQKVKQGTYFLPTNLSEEVVSFIEGMLQKDPKKRLSAHDLLKHDFLVKNVRQFKPLDVRKIPGAVQNGGILTVNAGAKNQANKLHETV